MYQENQKDIENLILNYFEGIYNGDVKRLKSCFHEHLNIYGDIKGAEYAKSVDQYLEGVNNRLSPKDLGENLKMSIIGMDIMGSIAMVKLHLPMLGYNYYDYLSLAKIDDNWKIVNKIFTHVE